MTSIQPLSATRWEFGLGGLSRPGKHLFPALVAIPISHPRIQAATAARYPTACLHSDRARNVGSGDPASEGDPPWLSRETVCGSALLRCRCAYRRIEPPRRSRRSPRLRARARGDDRGARGDRRNGDAEKGRPEDRKLAAIQRHATPPKPPNPNELKVKPDKDGKLRFSFEGQPWEAILEWLADCSGMSLDWQDLPGDYLNLSTPPGRSYTVREARDLINRYLLARGYTILTQGNVLSVVNVGKLNPVMVPRVDREQLEELVKQEPNAFVKVSIPLGWVSAETAVEELKPMLSPSGKLTALKESNRLESMDAAVNLYDVLQMLETEQSEQSQEGLVRKFVLNHGKAAEVCDQLKELMGLEAKPGRSGVSPERLATMMARAGRVIVVGRQEAQTQPPAGQPGGAAAAAKPKVDVSFAVNPRENSIVAVAPPEKMMIVAQAIKALDTPAKEGGVIPGHCSALERVPAGIDRAGAGNPDAARPGESRSAHAAPGRPEEPRHRGLRLPGGPRDDPLPRRAARRQRQDFLRHPFETARCRVRCRHNRVHDDEPAQRETPRRT